METIKEAYPDFEPTEKLVRFKCDCGAINSSNVYVEEEIEYVVCGVCWSNELYDKCAKVNDSNEVI